MKIAYNFLFILGLFSSIGVYSQNDSFLFLDEDNHRHNKKGFKVYGEALAGSNSLNTQMFTEVLVKPSFTEKSKSAFLDGGQAKTNLYASAAWGIEYQKDSASSFFMRNRRFQVYSSEKDFSELLFFGNGPFRGQNVTTSSLNYLQANVTEGGYRYNLLNREKLNINSSVGLSILSGYRQVGSQAISLYTARDGSYIDASFNNTSIVGASSGIQGLGLFSDIQVDYHTNKLNTVSFLANNINGYHLFESNEINIDTSFRFNGVFFDVFNSEASVTNYLDSAYNETINRNREDKSYVFLPTQIKLKWLFRLNPKSSIVSSFEALSLGKYGVTAQVAYYRRFGSSLKTKTVFGYGNFIGLTWSEAIEYRREKYSFFLEINNLQAAAIPSKTRNYGLSVGLFKQL